MNILVIVAVLESFLWKLVISQTSNSESRLLNTQDWWKLSNDSHQLPKCCNNGWKWKPYKQCKGSSVTKYRFDGSRNGGNHNSTQSAALGLAQALQGKSIVLIGDSLTRQLFESLLCFLGRSEWTGWQSEKHAEPALISDLRSRIGKVPRLNSGQIGYAHSSLDDKTNMSYYSLNQMSHENIVRILRFHQKAHRVYIDLHSLLVGYPGGELKGRIRQVVNACIELKMTGVCVLREATPQHFMTVTASVPSPSGAFTSGPSVFTHGLHNASYQQGQFRCANRLILQYESKARFRNDVIWLSRGPLKVLPTFDVLMGRGDGHHGIDCTHYAADAALWEPVVINVSRDLLSLTAISTFMSESH